MLDLIFYTSASICAVSCLALAALRQPSVTHPRVEWDEDVRG
ncbi:hypothetical protein AIGOOFII_1721 [Methylobacterium marchantiae]|nr:hypothetical protein AIGOOFII_1721 [Methylobacterium marchantiae]